MSSDKSTFANQQSKAIKDAITPFVASFGFMAHDINPPRICIGSCFFLVINGHWVMCTAAHVIDTIEELQASGVLLSGWHINDVFTKSSQDVVYPFDVMQRDRLRLRNDQYGLDYLLVYVERLAAESMAASGLKALSYEMTATPASAKKWILTGFPSHFTKKVERGVAQRHYILGVTPIDRPENWMPEANQYSIFGRIDMPPPKDEPLQDIAGMSGGPIFGLVAGENGVQHMKLVAIQSGWDKQSRVITACPIEPFLEAVTHLIAETGNYGD